MGLTRDQVTALILREDAVGMAAVGRALVHLLNRQTTEEANTNTTRNYNLRGFTPADARQGCIHAKFFIRHGRLESWHMAYWRRTNVRGIPRLAKYWAQLDQEAQRRAADRARDTV